MAEFTWHKMTEEEPPESVKDYVVMVMGHNDGLIVEDVYGHSGDSSIGGRMIVYMVHSERGEYSDWTYDVKGIFSTVEKAVEYIESQVMTVYRHVGVKYGKINTVRYDEWYDDGLPYTSKSRWFQQDDKVVDKRDIIPTSTDGRTFRYVMPDGKVDEVLWWDNYFIDEYEVDCAS